MHLRLGSRQRSPRREPELVLARTASLVGLRPRGESGGGAVNGEEQSGRRNGKLSCKEIQTPELFGPSFDRELGLCLVSTKLSSLYENVVSGTMDATRGAEMLFGLCSSEPPIGRQNMCPCVK